MSDLSSGRARLIRARSRRSVVACFCGYCDRLLYVAADAEVLFCPVCSSAVMPIQVGAEEDVAVG